MRGFEQVIVDVREFVYFNESHVHKKKKIFSKTSNRKCFVSLAYGMHSECQLACNNKILFVLWP